MPDYQVTNWTNEVPNGLPLRYRITDVDGTVLAAGAMIELLNVVTPGTPVNAANLNKMEAGIKTAQDTANAAETAAAGAQTSASLARSAASAAQTAANSAQATANSAQTAATNAAAAANLAQTTALARKPVITYAERTSEWFTGSSAFVDVPGLSITINLPATSTVIAFVTGTIRADAVYVGATVKIMINGTLSPVHASKSCNSSTTDISWVPVALNYVKTGVPAGNRTIKVQMANTGPGGSGNARIESGNLFVIAFQE